MLNGNIRTDFEVDESSQATLRIPHDGFPNRHRVTADHIGSTSFEAKLNHVQYGSWHGEDAVLLGFSFEFRFLNDSSKRMTSATVRLTLQATRDRTLSKPVPYDTRNDPRIVLLAPAQVRGQLRRQTITRQWSLQVPVQYNDGRVQVGVQGGFGQTTVAERDRSMSIDGFSEAGDDHGEVNEVVWVIQESRVQESGIPHRFPAAVVAILPRDPQLPVKLTGTVTPSVACSLNPLRVARLLQRRDDPVFLDRITPKPEKGEPFASGVDFGSEDYPWSEFVPIPREFSDQLTA